MAEDGSQFLDMLKRALGHIEAMEQESYRVMSRQRLLDAHEPDIETEAVIWQGLSIAEV